MGTKESQLRSRFIYVGVDCLREGISFEFSDVGLNFFSFSLWKSLGFFNYKIIFEEEKNQDEKKN